MPPIFAQPAPIPSGQFAGGGDYGSLASALQSRYSSDSDRLLRAQLGFAELDQDRAKYNEESRLRAQELAMRPLLQAQAADLELNSWMQKQRFTQQDQAELARQYTVVSELQDKFDKGEISRDELYQMMGKVAPRVNFLQAKEAHTKNQAMAEQHQAMAAANRAMAEERDQRLAFQRADLDGKIDYHILPQHVGAVAETMQYAYPELQKGSAEYDAMATSVAARNGWAVRGLKKADGSVMLDPRYTGMAGGEGGARGAGGGALGEAGEAKILEQVMNAALKHASESGKIEDFGKIMDMVMPQLQKHRGILRGQPSEEDRTKATENYKTAQGKLENQKSLVLNAKMRSDQKQAAYGVINELQHIYTAFPPSKRMAPEIAQRAERLEKQLDGMLFNVEAQSGKAPSAVPAGAPAPPNVPNEVWLKSLSQDVGNIGRAAVRTENRFERGLGEAGRRVGQFGQETYKGIMDARPDFVASFADYLFGG